MRFHRAHRVHEEREVARLRPRSPAPVAHAHGQETANATVVRCLQERALECWTALECVDKRAFAMASTSQQGFARR